MPTPLSLLLPLVVPLVVPLAAPPLAQPLVVVPLAQPLVVVPGLGPPGPLEEGLQESSGQPALPQHGNPALNPHPSENDYPGENSFLFRGNCYLYTLLQALTTQTTQAFCHKVVPPTPPPPAPGPTFQRLTDIYTKLDHPNPPATPPATPSEVRTILLV